MLGIYDFNLKFTYIFVQWEKFAQDFQVFEIIIINGRIYIPLK